MPPYSRPALQPAPQPITPWWGSLWVRVVAALVGFVGLTTAILFFSVDHFVKSRFSVVHDVRQERLIHLSQRAVADQLEEMRGIASLLANDAELVDGAYYDLHVDQGARRAQAPVTRIAQAFHFESVSLWTLEGRLIVAGGEGPPLALLNLTRDGRSVQTAAVRRGEEIWLVAAITLVDHGRRLALLQLAKPLTTLFRPANGTGVVVSIAHGDKPPAGVLRVPAIAGGDPAIAIDIIVPDEVGLALADVKRVLALVMTVFGVLLVTAIALLLRRLFQPVLEVIQATFAIGRGEFARIREKASGNEMGQLIKAFNRMSGDLQRLRKLEREAQHREQLSAIGRVAARVAHDLNNPLTVISSIARLVAGRDDIDAQMKEDMKLVLHHCGRSTAIIQALLAYGRPVRPNPQPLDFGLLCQEIAQRWNRRYPEVSLNFSKPPAMLVGLADPYRVEQMLDNLLDNARSFGGRIEVGVGSEDEMVFVSVTDNGPGFSAEAHVHLFEPFFTTREGGTGLGLASCLAIARAHGGDLDVDAGPPTKITVWLPLDSRTPPSAGSLSAIDGVSPAATAATP